MRVFARRERPHPGAQLSLFETADSWRYGLRATNLPTTQAGWRNNPAYIDAAHRVHARVEDRIRTGRDCALPHPAHRRPARPQRTPPPAPHRRQPALGQRHRTAWTRITALAQAP
jgi:hypothetical protein